MRSLLVMMIETTTFRLADGVADDVFLVTDDKVRTQFLYQQPGFVRATTARSADGAWILIVVWGDEEYAVDLPDELLSLCDSVECRRYETFD